METLAKTSSTSLKVTHRGWITAALLMSMFMTAIEITIVATAMPRIVAELGGFALLSWVFSSYLLTQVVSIPIYGKLSDLYGRKPVLICGLVIFLLASFLCGQATTMVQLIAFRFLQGIGGGAVQPISVTIIGDLFKPEERHRIQGMTGSVFAISSLVGPTLGALIVGMGHWSWIFYLNIPLAVIAILLLSLFLHEEKRTHRHKIDYGGAVLLVLSTSALMLGLLQGGSAWAWLSLQSFLCFSAFALFGLLLVKIEAKAKEPILPLWIFRHRLISIAGIATFLNGAMMIGYSAMIPTHVQGVLGGTALVGGLALAAMSVGWPIASFASGRIMSRTGYRNSAVGGAFLMSLGALGVFVFASTTPLWIGGAVFLVGLGLGLQSNAYIVTIQSSVSWKERGVATANNLFMRTLGSSVGVAAFGGVLNSTISRQMGEHGAHFAGGHGLNLVNELLGDRSSLVAAERAQVMNALSSGMTAVFAMAAVLAFLTFFVSFVLPKEVEVRHDI